MTDDEAVALMIPTVTVFDKWINAAEGKPMPDECSICGPIPTSMSPAGHVEEVHRMEYREWRKAGGNTIEAPNPDPKLRLIRHNARRMDAWEAGDGPS